MVVTWARRETCNANSLKGVEGYDECARGWLQLVEERGVVRNEKERK